MKRYLLSTLPLLILPWAQPVESGQVLRQSVQAKVRQSDLIVIADVQTVEPGRTIHEEQKRQWHALCAVRQVLKGSLADNPISVHFELPAEGIFIKPEPHSLNKGKTYLLFLTREDDSLAFISPYHGDVQIQNEYWIFDEDFRNDGKVLAEATSSINGVPSIRLSHDELVEKIVKIVADENEMLRRNRTLPIQPLFKQASERWSKVENGLQARLILELKPPMGRTDILDVVLQLKNVSTRPLAVRNDPEAVSVRLYDLRGYAVPQAGHSRSGPVPYPQWAIVPRDSSLRFSLYDCGVGIPANAGTLLALPRGLWLLKKGQYVLEAVFAVRKLPPDAPDNAWSGELTLPHVKFRTDAAPAEQLRSQEDHLWIEPPENFTGTWTIWDRSSRIQSQINYNNGKYHGSHTTYYPNGQKSTEQYYANHKADGPGRGWYPNGQKSYEIEYKDDMQHGAWTHWYPTGRKQARREYHNGLEHGAHTIWYDNGHKQLVVHYHYGKKRGTENAWDQQGNLRYTRNYDEDASPQPIE
jgi:hypothetical protein